MKENSRSNEQVIALVAERLRLGKNTVENGRVRVRVVTDVQETLAPVELTSEHVEIERMPINQEITAAPSIREEEGVTIIPILEMEEVVVVKRRMVLKEELRLRRVTNTTEIKQPVTLRTQRAEIDRPPKSDLDKVDPSTPTKTET